MACRETSSACASLVPRAAVQLARCRGIGAHIDQLRLVSGVFVDADDLSAIVRRDALHVDIALACLTLFFGQYLGIIGGRGRLTVPQALYTLP